MQKKRLPTKSCGQSGVSSLVAGEEARAQKGGTVRTSCSARMQPAISLPSLSTTPPCLCLGIDSSAAGPADPPGPGPAADESPGGGRNGLRRLGVHARRAT